MRKLAWFATGFTVGFLRCFYVFTGTVLYFVAGALFLLGVCLLRIPQFLRIQRIVAVVLLGVSCGFGWMQLFYDFRMKPAQAMDGKTVFGTVQITEYSYDTPTGVGVDGYIDIDGIRYNVRLYVSEVDSLSPGDQLTGSFELSYTGKEDISYLQGQGILLRIFVKEVESIEKADSFSVLDFSAYLRREIGDTIRAVFPKDTLGFAKALLLGNSEDLSYQDDVAFRNSGIRHIIAVSGLHVSILLSVLFSLTRRRRFLSSLIGIPVLLIFAAIAGFTPSVNRACLMQGLMLLSLLFNKEYDSPTSLAFAVLVILVLDPLSICSAGFQLSVGSILGIFLFSDKIYTYLTETKLFQGAKGKSRKAKIIRWTMSTISVSVSALVFTLPLSAFYFQSFSLVSVVTNLLTLWVVTYVFCGIGIAAILGLIWMPLGIGVAWVISWPMRYVTLIARLLGKLPISYLPADNIYMLSFLLFLYLLTFVFCRCKVKKVWMASICALVAFVVCITASLAESKADKFRVTILNVGQGQCILIQSDNSCYMVDCGGNSNSRVASKAVRTLWSNGIYGLDGIILTHYDKDHIGGVEPLLAQIQAERMYIPDSPDANGLRNKIEDNFNGDTYLVDEKVVLPCGNGEITIFPPHPDATGNQSSLCILFHAEDCDILITGDRNLSGEQQLMEQTTLPDLEVLVVGHHGSASSTGLPLLRATLPEVAVISVGEDNYYGHPEEEVLERLELFGCKILRTDIHGDIIIRR